MPGPWDWSIGWIPDFYRVLDRAAEQERARMPIVKRRVVHLEGVGFRTLLGRGCVDYELGESLNYHRPASIALKFPAGPQAETPVTVPQPHACPDPSPYFMPDPPGPPGRVPHGDGVRARSFGAGWQQE